jgi:hypothetical protein
VAVVALDAPGHDHVVGRQGAAVAEGEGHGYAVAADLDGGLATGGGVGGDPADEPHRGAVVVEAEAPADPVAIGMPAGQSLQERSRDGAHGCLLAILLGTICLLRCRCRGPGEGSA